MHIMNGTHLTSLSEMIALHLDCRANLPGCYQHECIRPPPRYDLAAGNSLQNLSGSLHICRHQLSLWTRLGGTLSRLEMQESVTQAQAERPSGISMLSRVVKAEQGVSAGLL